MRTKNSDQKSTSSHPLSSFFEAYQFKSEREGVECVIFTLSRLAISASFAPIENKTSHHEMMETTRDIFDSMVSYHQRL